MSQALTGAEQVAAALRQHKVQTIFTLSGNQILPLYDALFDDEVRLLSTRHEAAAVHMADAWGQLTGHAGVALVTAGPGHANALTALGVARGNESPVLLLSGAAEVSTRGTGAFQELSQAQLAAFMTKWAASVDHPALAGALTERALRLAEAPIPGPVSISLPFEVQMARADGPASAEAMRSIPPDHGPPFPAVPREDFGTLLRALAEAQEPLLLGSPWVARSNAFRAAAERLGCAAFALDSARAGSDPYLFGSEAAVARADLVVLLAPWDYTSRTEAILQPRRHGLFQIWPDGSMRLAGPALHALYAQPLEALRAIGTLAPRANQDARLAVAREQVAARDTVFQANVSERPPGVHPLRLAEAVRRRLGSGDVVTMDGGEFGQWARLGVGLGAWRTLTNGKFGPIGTAVPHALGARAVVGEGPAVVGFAGDGGFGYHAVEIETAVREHLPAIIIVGTDGTWGAEWHLQAKRYGAERRIASELSVCHYEELARGLGGIGLLLDDETQIESTLDAAWRAVRDGRVVLINALVPPLPSPAALH